LQIDSASDCCKRSTADWQRTAEPTETADILGAMPSYSWA
jgi:hypothetical protein